jgi:hypothetical protein
MSPEKLSCSGVRRVLRRLGCRRGRPRPGLQIPVKGRRQVLRKHRSDRGLGASAEEQDEADIHLNPKIGITYMKRGQQLVVLTPGKNVNAMSSVP